MDNVQICRIITKKIRRTLTDIIDITIEIQNTKTVCKGQKHEATTYTGLITTITTNQIYTATFTAHTWYKPIIQNKYITIDSILTQKKHIEINYEEVKPRCPSE